MAVKNGFTAGAERYMGSVKVGPKGQIVIPKEARDMFGIQPGDTLLLLADKSRGIAIQDYAGMQRVTDELFRAQAGEAVSPEQGVRQYVSTMKALLNDAEGRPE